MDSVRRFVQEFYDWYVPKTLNDNSSPAWNFAINIKRSVFSPQLAQALQDDSAAQAKADGEVVGLDFDPFLNSQDPGLHYKVGMITQKGKSYWVDVHSVSAGKLSVKPRIVAEVVRKNGQWCLVDFHYSNGHNLLGVLKELKESRANPTPQS